MFADVAADRLVILKEGTGKASPGRLASDLADEGGRGGGWADKKWRKGGGWWWLQNARVVAPSSPLPLAGEVAV